MPTPIYLDHHATTPCDPAVVDAMLPYFTERFGNAASRTHGFGFMARAATEHARSQVAALIGASPKEIVWTSGATESNNLAILGVARASRARGRHVVVSAIEHKAVLDPADALARAGFEVTRVRPNPDGVVQAAAVRAALRDDTVLVSLMLANNEIGTLQPVAEVGALCRARGIACHTDAAQAAGKIAVDAGALQVDLLSLSAHKMYGPKGVGALYVRRGRPRLAIEPVLFGGGHERGLRPGTLPVPLIVGMGVAAELAASELASGAIAELAALRDRLWAGLSKIDGVALTGSATERLANNLHVAFRGVEGQALIMGIRPVAVSSGSACTSESLEPSHVLRAVGVPDWIAGSSLRFGLGRTTTAAEIDEVVAVVTDKVAELRQLSPLYDVGSTA